MKVLLQFPEGLKKQALKFADKLEKKGDEVYISSSPCFGACDLPLYQAALLKVDKIIHFGHSEYPLKIKSKIPVEYIEYFLDFDIKRLERHVSLLKKYKKISLVSTVQYCHLLGDIKELFKKHGIRAVVSKPKLGKFPGQVLGCDCSVIKEKVVLYIGSGLFHPFCFKNKIVFKYDPIIDEFEEITEKIRRFRKRYKGAILKALYSDSFLILVSTKPGQFNLSLAKKIKKQLNKLGKKAYIMISNTFDPYALLNFNAQVYITTACPRMADDQEYFQRPILNVEMYKEYLKLLKS